MSSFIIAAEAELVGLRAQLAEAEAARRLAADRLDEIVGLHARLADAEAARDEAVRVAQAGLRDSAFASQKMQEAEAKLAVAVEALRLAADRLDAASHRIGDHDPRAALGAATWADDARAAIAKMQRDTPAPESATTSIRGSARCSPVVDGAEALLAEAVAGLIAREIDEDCPLGVAEARACLAALASHGLIPAPGPGSEGWDAAVARASAAVLTRFWGGCSGFDEFAEGIASDHALTAIRAYLGIDAPTPVCADG